MGRKSDGREIKNRVARVEKGLEKCKKLKKEEQSQFIQ